MNERHDEAMDPIATTLDEELVLYYYRDGLGTDRIEAIAATLAGSPELRLRYAELCAVLDAAREAPPPQPAAGLEARAWERLSARMAEDAAAERRQPRPVPALQVPARRRAPARRPWALAAALLVALALGVLLGAALMRTAPTSAPLADVPAAPAPSAPAPDDAMAARMLEAYVARHLRASQGLLLTTLNEEQGSLAGSGAELAASLVASNRLYAAAATRAGNARLAELLRQLEPLLIELANPAPAGDVQLRKGLREYVRDSDLLFRLRATEARLGQRDGRSA